MWAATRRFETEFLDYVSRRHKGIFDNIRETKDLPDDAITVLKDAVTQFKKEFQTSSGELLVKDQPVEALEAGEVGQEKIVRHVRPQPEKK